MVEEGVSIHLPNGKMIELNLALKNPNPLVNAHEISERMLLKGGKLWRPKLCFIMGDGLGLDPSNVAPYARIAELVHSASLAHDDVIDQATTRRNSPTLNAVYSEKKAILAGDLLLARAVSELCALGNVYITERMSQVVEQLSTGEWLQLEWKGRLDLPRNILETIRYYKTGCLMEWCCEVPMHLASATADDVVLAKKLGRLLGSAFQLIDDCLDFEVGTGKESFKDWNDGLINSVLFEYLSSEGVIPAQMSDFNNTALQQAVRCVREMANAEIVQALEIVSKLSKENRNFSSLEELLSVWVERAQ